MAKSVSKPVRVLVVEDNEDHAMLIRRAFRGERWTVDVSGTAEDALARVAERYDVILLDYKLPDMDGLELLDKIRAKDPSAAVIFITGEGSEEVAMTALSHGAMDYLTKRTSYHLGIAEVVEEALSKRDALLTGEEKVPTPEALEKALANVHLEGVLKAMIVMTVSGRPLAWKLPKGIEVASLATALSRIRVEVDGVAKLLKTGAYYIHLRLGDVGILIEPINTYGLLASIIDPPEAVASARVATRQVIDRINPAWT
ncbi:MAG: response regulator [Methanobacteriota archaeon]